MVRLRAINLVTLNLTEFNFWLIQPPNDLRGRHELSHGQYVLQTKFQACWCKYSCHISLLLEEDPQESICRPMWPSILSLPYLWLYQILLYHCPLLYQIPLYHFPMLYQIPLYQIPHWHVRYFIFQVISISILW